MVEQQTPPEKLKTLDEKECAALLKVRRETLSRLRRDLHLPFVAMGDGPKPRIRYIEQDVLSWLRARSRNLVGSSAPRKRGRPRNIDRAPDGGSR